MCQHMISHGLNRTAFPGMTVQIAMFADLVALVNDLSYEVRVFFRVHSQQEKGSGRILLFMTKTVA